MEHTIFMSKKSVTIKEAFEVCLEKRGIYKVIGLSKVTVSQYKREIRENKKYPSVELMTKLLKKAGYTMQQEETWNIPDDTDK